MWLEPDNSNTNGEIAYSVVPYIKFNVNISKELADLISGYEIVRVQRQDKDKTIATTGIISERKDLINIAAKTKKDMVLAAKEMDFLMAAKLRDEMYALERIMEERFS